jgi:hypothetical protein
MDDTRAQLEDSVRSVESILTGPEGYRDFKSRNDKVQVCVQRPKNERSVHLLTA